MDVTQAWKWRADDPLRRLSHPLQIFPLCIRAAGVPDCASIGQDTLDSRTIKVTEQVPWKSTAFQFPQEEEAFLGLFDQI